MENRSENLDEKQLNKNSGPGIDPSLFLPDEIWIMIFRYLNTKERSCCAQVCKLFNRLAYTPGFWKGLFIAQWSKGIWSCKETNADEETAALPCSSMHTEATDDQRVSVVISCMLNHLPHIGHAVTTLCLSATNVTDELLRMLLIGCSHLESLDLSYTPVVGHIAFKDLKECRSCQHLKYLSFSGCKNLVDECIIHLINCWSIYQNNQSGDPSVTGLISLNLSGCQRLTNKSVVSLQAVPAFFRNLKHVDFSGCFMLTSKSLRGFASVCPQLKPENLYYCHNVHDGPYNQIANGCNNLESTKRVCCSFPGY